MKHKYIVRLITFIISLFIAVNPLQSQVMATAEQKAKALYINHGKIALSEERREENENESPKKLEVPGDMGYTIDGPKKVEYGSKQTYNVLPRAPENGWWYVSCGTALDFYDDNITIHFNVTSCNYCEIMLFDAGDHRIGYLKVTILGNTFPLSAGRILTGSQSINKDSIAGTLVTTFAEGGTCNNLYQYQWQYSYDDGIYFNIEDGGFNPDLVFAGPHERDMWFRRRVICGADTLYTGSVAVLIIRPLFGGTITDWPKMITAGTSPGAITASTPLYCESNTYSFQWQQSADGQLFSDIAGATAAALNYNGVIDQATFIRRQVKCEGQTAYTNNAIIEVKPILPVTQPVSEIDSLLALGGENVYATLNIPSDSIANNRTPESTEGFYLDREQEITQRSFLTNNGYSALTAEQLAIMNGLPPVDDVLAKITDSSYPQRHTAFIPFIDDALVQQYRSIQDYHSLDSLFKTIPELPFETLMQPVQAALQEGLPEAQRDYNNLLLYAQFTQSGVVSGQSLIAYNEVHRYTADFHFPVNGTVTWVANGGTIIAKNNNPANGQLYVDVRWNTFNISPYVLVADVTGRQYGLLRTYYLGGTCNVFPQTQTLYYGQQPAQFQVATCYQSDGGATSIIYQWQKMDAYSGIWADIPGSNSASWQPPALDAVWLFYRRITYLYNSSGTLLYTYYSSTASVQLKQLDAGTIECANTHVPWNTLPVVTSTRAASGGYLAPGNVLTHRWEYAVGSGAWQAIGEGINLPSSFRVLQNNTRVRRVAFIAGTNTNDIPSQYLTAVTPEITFTTFYQTTDYENRNYVRIHEVLTRGINTWIEADLLPIDKKGQITRYVDGLGRPIEVVNKGTHYDEATGEWWDMVKPFSFEPGGRVEQSFLPYPSKENIGKFKENAISKQTAYYNSQFGESLAYAKAEYDNSPLNRIKKISAPGSSWVGANTGRSGDIELYNINENVVYWQIGYNETDKPQYKGYYPAQFLLKTVSLDEKGKKVINYLNRNGSIVLRKVQLADGPALTGSHGGWLCTYYVYDDFGQLRYEITPKAVEQLDAGGWQFSDVLASELCFIYTYDEYGRLISKKTPGRGKEEFVYDRRNRPIFVQDANQRAKNPQEWTVTLYDGENRDVITGLWYNNITHVALQNLANNTPATEQQLNTGNGGTIKIFASPLSASDINSNAFVQLSFNYYDSYTYVGVKPEQGNIQLAYKDGNVDIRNSTKRYQGLPTGSRVRVLDDANTFLATTVYYDEDGRTIQTLADNIKQGVDISSVQYHFDGRLLSEEAVHNAPGTGYTNFPILTKLIYDKAGRLKSVAKKINNNNRTYQNSSSINGSLEDADTDYKIISKNEYNELGRRVKKILSPSYNNGQGIETLEYSYNMQGWLTGINKDYALGELTTSQWDHYFGIYLGYDNRDNKFTQAQLNGHITGVLWKSQGDNTSRKFDYNYDNAGRLTSALFKQKPTIISGWENTKSDYSTPFINYDANGNITAMAQRAILPGAASPVNLDNLNYTYLANSNKLLKVQDNSQAGNSNGKLGDFKDGNNTGDDYNYDDNGNIINDGNRNVAANTGVNGNGIVYNYLNKPVTINVKDKGTIKYIYDAAGEKQQKIVTDNTTTPATITTSTYIGAFVYEKITKGATTTENLAFIQHGEGRIRVITPYDNPNDPANFIDGGIALPGGKQGVFDYYIKDHLSNVRVTVTEEVQRAAAVCTMEDAVATVQQQEEGIFGNSTNNEVAATRVDRPAAWTSATVPPQTLSDNKRVSKLIATGGTPQIGPNSFLRVMAGDVVAAKADYYYLNNPGNSGSGNGLTTIVANLIGALSGGRGTQVFGENAVNIGNTLNVSPDLQQVLSDNTPTSTPKAYLNYLFFDEQFNFVAQNSGYIRVSQPGNGATPLAVTNAKAVKNGYVYIYLSNESGEPVYFDNFTVSHVRGQLLEENHYYAFGLKIAGISSKSVSSSLNTKMPAKGYGFAEELVDFDLNYNEFFYRHYDPQIGRWTTPDPFDEFPNPYTGIGNNPANFTDPTGGFIDPLAAVACPGTTSLGAFLTSISAVTKIASAIAIGGGAMSHIDNLQTYNIVSGSVGPTAPGGQSLAVPGISGNSLIKPYKPLVDDNPDVVRTAKFRANQLNGIYEDLNQNNSALDKLIRIYRTDANFKYILDVDNSKVSAGAQAVTGRYAEQTTPDKKKLTSVLIKSFYKSSFVSKVVQNGTEYTLDFTDIAKVNTLIHEMLHAYAKSHYVKEEDQTHNLFDENLDLIIDILKEYNVDKNLNLSDDDIFKLAISGSVEGTKKSKKYMKYIKERMKKSNKSFEDEVKALNDEISGLTFKVLKQTKK